MAEQHFGWFEAMGVVPANTANTVNPFSNDMRDHVPGVGGDWSSGWRNAHIPNAAAAQINWPYKPYVGDVQQCQLCWQYYPLGGNHTCPAIVKERLETMTFAQLPRLGWTCPRCSRNLSPDVKYCDCESCAE
jgi:hypothetical protein